MRRRIVTAILITGIALYPLVFVEAAYLDGGPAAVTAAAGLSNEQIDNLMAPIALYPDPLLAQMLPASTFVDQVDQAARYLRSHNNQATGVDSQKWDISVKSISHYPEVVYMMAGKLDWTTAVGQAYVSQAADVFKSIQRLRATAKKYGYLTTTSQQTVVVEKDIIKIVPAQPQYIYVPTYNPQVVYVAPPSSGPSTGAIIASTAIAFTSGLMIGAWLNNDCDWYGHSVYYHGWHGVGWVASSASIVHWNNSYYVNSRYSTVHYNTAVINRPVNYNNVSLYTGVSRTINYNNVNVNRNIYTGSVNNVNVNLNIYNGGVNNVNVNRNIYSGTVSNVTAKTGVYRGRTTSAAAATRTRTSGFASYGSAAQVRAQSTRGAVSRSSAAATTTTRTRSVRVGRRGY